MSGPVDRAAAIAWYDTTAREAFINEYDRLAESGAVEVVAITENYVFVMCVFILASRGWQWDRNPTFRTMYDNLKHF